VQIVHEVEGEPVPVPLDREPEAVRHLLELLRGRLAEAAVGALRFGDRPSAEGGRRGGGREHEPGEQEGEVPLVPAGAGELFDHPRAPGVVHGRQHPRRADRPEPVVRTVGEQLADRRRLAPEDRLGAREERVLRVERRGV
jgi:hypothetical protein